MLGLSKRVNKSVEAILNNDLEDSLYQIAAAIEATAKQRYPSLGPRDRVEKFLADEQTIIYGFSTQNRLKVPIGTKVLFGQDGELQEIIYTYIRCNQAHEAEIDLDRIHIGGEYGVARMRIEGASEQIPDNKYLCSRATVIALIFSVICANENQNIQIQSATIPMYGRLVEITTYIGKRSEFITFYGSLFDN